MEMHRRQLLQAPNLRGFRMSRWAVVRNTNPMLKTTTIKTYEDWLKPEHYGAIKMAPPPFEHEIDMALPDGTRLIVEVLFLSLDRPEDMRKLLSLELTGAFTNETRELPKTIIDGITQRLRRYPAVKDGGASWSGLLMDTNAPDEDHWWPIMAGEAPPPEGMSEQDLKNLIKPANWEFFTQPGAMIERRAKGKHLGYEINPEGENHQNLDPKYYTEMITGKSHEWIQVYVLNELGSVADGRPVTSDFSREVHVSPIPLEPVPDVKLIVGMDFGLTPAMAIMQRVRGRWLVLREIVLADAGAIDAARHLTRVLADEFPGWKVAVLWGDPAGDARVGTDRRTPFQIMRAAGFPARPVETNDPEIRRAAGQSVLRRMEEGAPAVIFDPSCKVLIAGLSGAWCYKRVRSANGESFEDDPMKNRYSHICEAWEYALVGGGEARAALGRKAGGAKLGNTRVIADPLARMKSARPSMLPRANIYRQR
jgi:hypothetical protein